LSRKSGIEGVADDHEHRHAVAERVIDGHRSVLQPDRSVRAHEKRLVLDLGVAMGDGDRGFSCVVESHSGAAFLP
jgi:hypothetical protein